MVAGYMLLYAYLLYVRIVCIEMDTHMHSPISVCVCVCMHLYMSATSVSHTGTAAACSSSPKDNLYLNEVNDPFRHFKLTTECEDQKCALAFDSTCNAAYVSEGHMTCIWPSVKDITYIHPPTGALFYYYFKFHNFYIIYVSPN